MSSFFSPFHFFSFGGYCKLSSKKNHPNTAHKKTKIATMSFPTTQFLCNLSAATKVTGVRFSTLLQLQEKNTDAIMAAAHSRTPNNLTNTAAVNFLLQPSKHNWRKWKIATPSFQTIKLGCKSSATTMVKQKPTPSWLLLLLLHCKYVSPSKNAKFT